MKEMDEVKEENSVHTTVLLNETIEGLALDPKKDSVILDATFGGGGHTMKICEMFPKARLIVFDQDREALKRGKERLKDFSSRISFENRNFRDMESILKEKEALDAIIFDLGLSSDQLEGSGRGFSFMKDEPLLMTMKENPRPEDLKAYEIVNDWNEDSIADILFGYGEERFAKRIAKAIVEAREKKEIKTTFDLVKIIESAVPSFYKRGKIHPATKTFQALRIAVNDELGALTSGLQQGFKYLKKGGRMAVIAFHSLEDRIVKRFFQAKAKEKEVILINKKPIIPKEKEVKENKRSRSAKLRVLEKIK